MKEQFKEFVKNKPELIEYVNSGEMTWQKFFEQWSLYGEDEKVWGKYLEKEKKEESLNFSTITDFIKKVDAEQIKKGVNSIQKVVELLQGLTLKENANNQSYEPRKLFKKFED